MYLYDNGGAAKFQDGILDKKVWFESYKWEKTELPDRKRLTPWVVCDIVNVLGRKNVPFIFCLGGQIWIDFSATVGYNAPWYPGVAQLVARLLWELKVAT